MTGTPGENLFLQRGMDYPVRPLGFLAGAFFAATVTSGAEAPAAVKSPELSLIGASLHSFSSRTGALLTAGMPKFKPIVADAPPATDKAPEKAGGSKPADGIVRLPKYVVHEPRLPTPQEVMTRKELENYAMNRFLGPEDGFDRGFLNFFTLAWLWQKIPLLGRIPFVPFGSVTNAGHAMTKYAEAERKRKMKELTGLMSLTRESGRHGRGGQDQTGD